MHTRQVTIQNEEGFHVRPAQLFAAKAAEFTAEVTLKRLEGGEANAKSMLGLMTLGLRKGSTITIEADGPDEQQAVDALAELVESKFGEGR
jgi:phosphocarrier protein HPr